MRNSFVFILIYLISHLTKAQTPFFQNYNLANKNEKIEVKTIFQDSHGFIWAGADNGLYRYDGFDFLHFTTHDSLPDNQVTAIAQDSLGRVWMGHSNGRLSYFEHGKIKAFTTREGLGTKEISDIIFDKKGVLWFSTLNDGLYYFIHNRLYRLDEEDGMPDLYIYDLAESPDGNIWAGTDRGIAICELNNDKPKIQVVNQKLGLPDNIVRKIGFKSSDSILLGTQDSRVIHYNPSSKKFTSVLANWEFGTILDLIIKQDQVWVSCAQKGIVMIDTKNSNTYNNFFFENLSSSLLLDHEGNIWIGNKSKLIRTQGTEITFFGKLASSINQNIIAITTDNEQSIWFSNSEGLFKIKKNSKAEKIGKSEFVNPPVISLHSDSLGNIWAGTFGAGAYLLNTKGEVIRYFKNDLRNGNILSINSHGNDIWFATLEGVTQLKRKGNSYEIKNFGTKEGLSSDYIYQVFPDSRGRVWLATDGQDIDMLDKEGVHHFMTGDKPKVIYGFTEAGNHTILANVQNEGLYQLLKDTFSPVKKLRNNNIHSLTVNSLGNVVVVHDLGVEVIDIEKNQFRLLGDEVGIKEMRGNLNSICKSQSGEIFIGTENGIIKYQPSTIKEEIEPNPFVYQLKAANKIFTAIDHLVFSYNENDIAISYLGFWYHNPQNLTYQYQLENYDRNWINSKNREVIYSRLPPGQYTFRLRASDSEDFKNAKEVTIHFKINSPFWQRGWFYLLVIILVICIGYLYVQFKGKKLLKERQVLKRKVEERTKELNTRNEEVEAQAEKLQAQADEIKKINDHLEELVKSRTIELEKKNKALEEYAFINAHKLRSPLATILGLVNLMKRLPHTAESKECTEHLGKSAKELDEVVSSITQAIERAE